MKSILNIRYVSGLKWTDGIPELHEPAFVLGAGHDAAGEVANVHVGDLVAVHTVIGGYVVGTYGAAQNYGLGFPAIGRPSNAFDNHVAIGQDINHTYGKPGSDAVCIINTSGTGV